jgi:hypothetical protein
MLEAISDFWKPIKKSQSQEKLRPEQLQVGSTIGFGFVPQASLSGRKLMVAAINTYQFGDERLTSFVLGADKEAGVSMIVAEAEGEQYLAISRRLTIGDRMKMFTSEDLESVIEKADVTQLSCKDTPGDFRGWVVAAYKREIQGLEGRIFKGDFRKAAPPADNIQTFKYTLLVSDNNEHAVEIEKYKDGRIEVYATVYRRLSDVAEISQPSRVGELNRPDLKLASRSDEKPEATAPVSSPRLVETAKPAAFKPEPIKLQEFTPVNSTAPTSTASKTDTVKPAAAVKAEAPKPEEKPRMQATENTMNGAAKTMQSASEKPTLTSVVVQPNQNFVKQEVRAVSKLNGNGLDNEAIECDLRVANKIIDEAIRNEMRLSDVVRRIVELPVAHQEAVHIPVTLSDEDYALLAIRYSMSPSERSAIKARIIEELNDFSGDAKKKAA